MIFASLSSWLVSFVVWGTDEINLLNTHFLLGWLVWAEGQSLSFVYTNYGCILLYWATLP